MSASADHVSYQRATTISLLGLALQVVATLMLLIYGLQGDDPGAFVAGVAMLLGVPIWVALTLVLHQHKLERIEAMEAESYRRSAAGQSSVFGETGEDETVHARRLAWMHKWFLPTLSVIVGGLYILGGWLFFSAVPSAADFTPPEHAGWAIAIGTGIAAVSFVFARFVAGMAKQDVWMLLNAGAGASVGAALLGALVALAHFLAQALNNEELLRLVPRIVHIYMLAVGAEIALNFLLNIYRPRKPGEYLRAAFDSRILAFLAAPDRLADTVGGALNYQFGFNVSSTWFYKLLSRWVTVLLVAGVVLVWGMSVFAVVRPDESGLLLKSGELAKEPDGTPRVLEPGLVIKRPWPAGEVITFTAEAVNEIVVGTRREPERAGAPVLWSDADAPDEEFFIVQPTRIDEDDDSARDDRRRDIALLSIEIPIHYVVDDIEAYFRLAQDGPPGDREAVRREMLRSLAYNAAAPFVARFSVDDVLGEARDDIADGLTESVQRGFDRAGSGVRVIYAGVANARPKSDAAAAFENVVAADARRQSTIEAARGERARLLSEAAGSVENAMAIMEELEELDELRDAGADAQTIERQEQDVLAMIIDAGGEAAIEISDARQQRWETQLAERARAIRSRGQLSAFRAAPTAFKMDYLFRAYAAATANSRVFITSGRPALEIEQLESNQDLGFRAPADEELEN